MPTAEEFWSKVAVGGSSECWPWTGCLNGSGYGAAWWGGRVQKAHRVAYELTHGHVPDVLDHVCHNVEGCPGGSSCAHRACCNPNHLEPSTIADNARRGHHRNEQMTRTHCPAGHAYEGRNLHVRPDGRRRCRACARDYMRRRRADQAV